jgi:hypothetical protein
MLTYSELIKSLEEALKRKVVYRDGKKVIQKKSDKEGYKTQDGKEVKMSAKERLTRSKTAKKAAKKKKGKQGAINRARAKTMKKRG